MAAASLTYSYLSADKHPAESPPACNSHPELFSEGLTVATLQAGAALVIIFQTLYLIIDLRMPPHPLFTTVPYHLFNIGVSLIGFVLTMMWVGRVHWRALALWVVAAVL